MNPIRSFIERFKSELVFRASVLASGVSAAVVVISYLIIFGQWNQERLAWAEIIDANLTIDWRWILDPFEPLKVSLVLGLASGILTQWIVILRSIRSARLAPAESSELTYYDLLDRGIAWIDPHHPRASPHSTYIDSFRTISEKSRNIIGTLVRCSDLRRHHMFDAFARTGAGPVEDIDSIALQKLANGDEKLLEYVYDYPSIGPTRITEDRMIARAAWFRSRDPESLLNTGVLGDVISFDDTLPDILSELAERHTPNAMAECGILVRASATHYEPTVTLIYDAPVYPHYDQNDVPVALSHSLSPILAYGNDDLTWDRREIFRAGKHDGALFVTAGIRNAAALRSKGHHAIAIHPHVWAHTVVASGWPLPGVLADKVRYSQMSGGFLDIQRYSHWLAMQLRDAGIHTLLYDLPPNFAPVFGEDTWIHRIMPQFLFRAFVRRQLAPTLRSHGVRVIAPPPLGLSYLRSGRAYSEGSPGFVLYTAGYDLYGESVLFGIADRLVNPNECWIGGAVDSELSALEVPSTLEVAEQSDAMSDIFEYAMAQDDRGHWQVSFGGEVGRFKNWLGFRYIAALLTHPHSRIDAKQLSLNYGTKKAPPGEWVPTDHEVSFARTTDRHALGDGFHEDLSGAVSATREVKIIASALTRQLTKLEHELEEAGDMPPEGMDRTSWEDYILSLERQRDAAKQKLANLPAADKLESVALRVAKNIRDAIEAVRDAGMVKCAAYLKSTLSPLESPVIEFKPNRGDPPGASWKVIWKRDW